MKENELSYIKYIQNILFVGEIIKKGTEREEEKTREERIQERKEGMYSYVDFVYGFHTRMYGMCSVRYFIYKSMRYL